MSKRNSGRHGSNPGLMEPIEPRVLFSGFAAENGSLLPDPIIIVEPTTIELTPLTASINSGQQVTLRARFAAGWDADQITWTLEGSSGGDNLTSLGVENNEAVAVYTAPASGAGSVSIRASGLFVTSTATVFYAPLPPLEAPSSLVSDAQPTQITLSWSDNSSAETGFLIQRSTDGSNWSDLVSVSADVTSYIDLGLSPQTDYWYRVQAYNDVQQSIFSAPSLVHTPPVVVSPSGLSATPASYCRIALQWEDNESSETGYLLQRSTDGDNWTDLATLPADSHSFVDRTAQAGVRYFYRVQAIKGELSSAWTDPMLGMIVGAGRGNGVTARIFSSVDFTGLAETRVDPQVRFRAETGGENFSAIWKGQIIAPDTGSYTLFSRSDGGVRVFINGQVVIDNWADHAATTDSATIDLLAGHKYNIKVRYYNPDGAALMKLRWTGPGVDRQIVPQENLFSRETITVPMAASDLRATATSSGNVLLSWDDNGDNESGYRIERSVDGVNFEAIGRAPGASNHYVDQAPGLDAVYYYRVTAFNGAGSADASNTVQVQMPLIGSGDGLVGRYYSNNTFGPLVGERIDPAVKFNWGLGAPLPGTAQDEFSVRWEGLLEAQYSETYTLALKSAGSVRMWIDGQLVIDNWTDHAATTDTATVSLQAGQKYSIRIDYANNTGEALIRLKWACDSTPMATIPTSQLYSA